MMFRWRRLMIVCPLLCSAFCFGAEDPARPEVRQLRAEMEQLRQDYEHRLQALEQRLKLLESTSGEQAARPAMAVPPVPPPASNVATDRRQYADDLFRTDTE